VAENEVNTGGGASIGGNVDSGGGDVAARDSRKENVNEVTNKPQASSAVVIYNQPPQRVRKRQPPASKGELMADAAQTLWQAIADLSGTIGELKASVEQNSRATDRQADSIQHLSQASEDQVRRTEAQFKAVDAQIQAFAQIAQALRAMKVKIPDDNAVILAPARQLPWWQPYATPVLLTLILAVILAYLSTGGRIP
jgi:hypothetical protein